jgi:hypothetical protein
MPDPAGESVSHAIELMTAWLECPDDSVSPLAARLQRIISEPCAGDSHLAGAVELVLGLTSLNGSLLFLLEEKGGITAHETLQQLALQFAREDASE